MSLYKNSLFIFLFIFVFIKCSLSNENEIDWCDVQSKYCLPGKKHIGCEDTLSNGNCMNMHVIPMNNVMKGYILTNHNNLRNDLAGGRNTPYLSASRMRELHWNDDLSKLAEIHVKHCKYQHDQCRSTPKHHYAGQNIAQLKNKKKTINYSERINKMVKNWFNEKRFSSINEIANFTGTNPKEIRHFTTMIQDNANEIGCAYVIFELDSAKKHWHSHLMTCNYGYTNFLHQPVYKLGPSCSGCSEFNETCSQTYSNLCTIDTPSAQPLTETLIFPHKHHRHSTIPTTIQEEEEEEEEEFQTTIKYLTSLKSTKITPTYNNATRNCQIIQWNIIFILFLILKFLFN